MKDDDLEANIVAAGSAYSQGRYEEALALYETAITARPQNAILFANKAAILLRLDRVDDALISADRAIELDPTWAKVRARTEVHFVNLWIEEKRDKLALRGVTVRFLALVHVAIRTGNAFVLLAIFKQMAIFTLISVFSCFCKFSSFYLSLFIQPSVFVARANFPSLIRSYLFSPDD
ncbi:unnamed protein product [Heligmosomoides polygyrus]|uniref:TPR_REGION domain-containing protein n=1 Tax=Heligmosomoides polygyrus TaxID=6339 RepID=A0A183GCQ7_HELPZ|nr:unnamed protein product [Heligmosomoides polygyrus]